MHLFDKILIFNSVLFLLTFLYLLYELQETKILFNKETLFIFKGELKTTGGYEIKLDKEKWKYSNKYK